MGVMQSNDPAAMSALMCSTSPCRTTMAATVPADQMPPGVDVSQAITCMCDEPAMQTLISNGGNMTTEIVSSFCASDSCSAVMASVLASAPASEKPPNVADADILECTCASENTMTEVLCASARTAQGAQGMHLHCPTSAVGLPSPVIHDLCAREKCAPMVTYMASKMGTADSCASVPGVTASPAPPGGSASASPSPPYRLFQPDDIVQQEVKAPSNPSGSGGSAAPTVLLVLVLLGLAGGGGWYYYKKYKPADVKPSDTGIEDVAPACTPSPDSQVNSMNELNDAARAAAAQENAEASQDRL